MRVRMRVLLLSAVGSVVIGGSAAAQAPAPASMFVQAQQPATFVQAGCNSCGGATDTLAGKHQVGGHLLNRAYHNSPLTIGPGCPNPIGCGSWASERTFLFGSCKQFFNPGGKCDSYWDRFARNVTTPLGAGGLGAAGPCDPLFSHHNR